MSEVGLEVLRSDQLNESNRFKRFLIDHIERPYDKGLTLIQTFVLETEARIGTITDEQITWLASLSISIPAEIKNDPCDRLKAKVESIQELVDYMDLVVIGQGYGLVLQPSSDELKNHFGIDDAKEIDHMQREGIISAGRSYDEYFVGGSSSQFFVIEAILACLKKKHYRQALSVCFRYAQYCSLVINHEQEIGKPDIFYQFKQQDALIFLRWASIIARSVSV